MFNSTSKRHILVVDDSELQAKYLQHALEQKNYSVQLAYNAKEALNYLKDKTPDLIITDVVMPEMNGFELCRIIKQDPATAKIPVILLTALSEPEDIIAGLGAGADNFITKPYSNDFLFSRIEYCLINAEMRKNTKADMGIEVVFGGKRYQVNSDRIQILDLLLSTYESTVEKNRELEKTVLELRKTQRELIKAKEYAEQTSKYKSEFLANISHEIRTPLNIIVGIADSMIESDNLTEEQKNNLTVLKNASNTLLNMLNDILDLSKIEAGKIELRLEPFDIAKLISEVTALFKDLAKSKGIELRFSMDTELPKILVGDPSKIKQVLINLISNAVKFTEQGSITIDVKRDKGQINSDDKTLTVQFTVSDTGIGIPPDKLDHIFDAFVQADGSTTRRHGGTGLGLSISRGLVEIMGGILSVKSELGKGSSFNFSLPLKTEDAMTGVKDKQDGGSFRPLHILVVDDNELNQMVAARLLTKKGHNVSSAYTGQEAIDKIKVGKFDVVFMDVSMPEMDGFETTRRLREWESSTGAKPTPIIAMTAHATKEDRDRCLDSGMDDYITKPIDLKVVEQVLIRYQ